MLRRTALRGNPYLTWHKAQQPNAIVRNHDFWHDPQRMYKAKLLHFALGVDQLALRRTAVMAAENHRIRRAAVQTLKWTSKNDPTGFAKAQNMQTMQWHYRMRYQEWYLQHLHLRHAWAMLRKYPVGGAKIAGVTDTPYFGYDNAANRFTREAQGASAKVLYPRRRI